MTTYIVFQRLKTKDKASLDKYAEVGGATLAGRSFKAHAFYGSHKVVEGAPHEGIAIVSFPSRAEAEDWYNSPAYREAREHRFRGADYQVTIVDGIG